MHPDSCLNQQQRHKTDTNETTLSSSYSCLRGDKYFHTFRSADAWCKIIFFCLSLLPLLLIHVKSRTRPTEKMKQMALYQAIIHQLAIILSSIIPLWIYATTTVSGLDSTFSSFHTYISMLCLCPSLGILHLLAYFIITFKPTRKGQSPIITDIEGNTHESSEEDMSRHDSKILRASNSISSLDKGLLNLSLNPLDSNPHHSRKRWSFAFTTENRLANVSNDTHNRLRLMSQERSQGSQRNREEGAHGCNMSYKCS